MKRLADAVDDSDEEEEVAEGGGTARAAIMRLSDEESNDSNGNVGSESDADSDDENAAAAVPADSPELAECVKIISEMTPKVEAVTAQAKMLVGKVTKGNLDTTKGISLLEVKLQLMLSYNVALGIFMMLKLEGKRIENHPIIERMYVSLFLSFL